MTDGTFLDQHGKSPQVAVYWIEDEAECFQCYRSEKKYPFVAKNDGRGHPLPLIVKGSFADPFFNTLAICEGEFHGSGAYDLKLFKDFLIYHRVHGAAVNEEFSGEAFLSVERVRNLDGDEGKCHTAIIAQSNR